MPPPLTATFAPNAKFEPVSVTATLLPGAPEFDAIALNTGAVGISVTVAVPTADGVAALDAVTVTLPDGAVAGAVYSPEW
jgi:hypothetical protein